MPPSMYGVLSKEPVAARRASSRSVPLCPAPASSALFKGADAARPCSVTCGEGLVVAAGSADSEVALADGTNHRAHSRVPAAVAVG